MEPAPQQQALPLDQLRYSTFRELSEILDPSSEWEKLAGVMNLKYEEVINIRQSQKSGTSATQALISLLKMKGCDCNHLFDLLLHINNIRGMTVLLPFVDQSHREKFAKLKSTVLNSGVSQLPTEKFSNNAASAVNDASIALKAISIRQAAKEASGVAGSQPNSSLAAAALPSPSKASAAGNNAGGVCPHVSPKRIAGINGPSLLKESSGVGPVKTPLVPPSCSHTCAHAQSNTPRAQGKCLDSCLESSLKSTLKIPYKDLEVATGAFNEKSILGRGGYGVVYRGVWLQTPIAVKRLESPDGCPIKERFKQSLCELQALSFHRHDNILPLYGYSLDGVAPCLVYQFMAGGSLEDRILCRKDYLPLRWDQKHSVAFGAARGINFLHTCSHEPLIHGDIKSGNILLDEYLVPKIGDFGLSRKGIVEVPGNTPPMIASHIKGTLAYLPPEFLRNKHLSSKLDVYSFGVVLFELATGSRAHLDNRKPENLVDFVRTKATIASKEDLEQLIDKRNEQQDYAMFGSVLDFGYNPQNTGQGVLKTSVHREKVCDVSTFSIADLKLELQSLAPFNVDVSTYNLFWKDMQNELVTLNSNTQLTYALQHTIPDETGDKILRIHGERQVLAKSHPRASGVASPAVSSNSQEGEACCSGHRKRSASRSSAARERPKITKAQLEAAIAGLNVLADELFSMKIAVSEADAETPAAAVEQEEELHTLSDASAGVSAKSTDVNLDTERLTPSSESDVESSAKSLKPNGS